MEITPYNHHCEGSFLPSFLILKPRLPGFESSLRSYPINPCPAFLAGQGGDFDSQSVQKAESNSPPCRKQRDKDGAPAAFRCLTKLEGAPPLSRAFAGT